MSPSECLQQLMWVGGYFLCSDRVSFTHGVPSVHIQEEVAGSPKKKMTQATALASSPSDTCPRAGDTESPGYYLQNVQLPLIAHDH